MFDVPPPPLLPNLLIGSSFTLLPIAFKHSQIAAEKRALSASLVFILLANSLPHPLYFKPSRDDCELTAAAAAAPGVIAVYARVLHRA
jgi:hypothetical protein